jgi:hypothetical protein
LHCYQDDDNEDDETDDDVDEDGPNLSEKEEDDEDWMLR